MTCTGPRGHKFQKFDDTSLFCERCGERKVIADEPTSQAVYVPTVPYVQPYPYWPNTWHPQWHYPYEVWCDSGTSTWTADTTSFGDTNKHWFPQQAVNTNAVAGPQTCTPRGVR